MRRDVAGDHLESRRLAGTVAAEEPDNFARRQGHSDVVDHASLSERSLQSLAHKLHARPPKRKTPVGRGCPTGVISCAGARRFRANSIARYSFSRRLYASPTSPSGCCAWSSSSCRSGSCTELTRGFRGEASTPETEGCHDMAKSRGCSERRGRDDGMAHRDHPGRGPTAATIPALLLTSGYAPSS